MRYVLISLLVLCGSASAISAAPADGRLDRDGGLPTLKLGAPRSALPKGFAAAENTNPYTGISEEIGHALRFRLKIEEFQDQGTGGTFDNARYDTVVLTYFEDRLCEITVTATAKRCPSLEQAFLDRYGPPAEPEKDGFEAWQGKKVRLWFRKKAGEGCETGFIDWEFKSNPLRFIDPARAVKANDGGNALIGDAIVLPIPAGWSRVPDLELTGINEQLAKFWPEIGPVPFQLGLQPAKGLTWLDLPQVWVDFEEQQPASLPPSADSARGNAAFRGAAVRAHAQVFGLMRDDRPHLADESAEEWQLDPSKATAWVSFRQTWDGAPLLAKVAAVRVACGGVIRFVLAAKPEQIGNARLTLRTLVQGTRCATAEEVAAERRQHHEPRLKLPNPSDPKAWRATLHSIDERLARLRPALVDLRTRASEVIAFLKDREAKRRSEILGPDRDVHDKYPATAVIDIYQGKFRAEGYVSDPDVMKQRIDSVLIRVDAMKTCTRALIAETKPAPAECGELLACEGSVGSDGQGLFSYSVERGYDLRKNRVTGPGDLLRPRETDGRSEAFRLMVLETNGIRFDACTLLSLLRPTFEPKVVTVNWWHYPHELFSQIDQDMQLFRDTCGAPPESNPNHAKLKALAARFPEDEELQDGTARLVRICQGNAHLICKSVFKIRNNWALAYPTKGCDVRRVTAKDIANDVQNWTHATEVEKLEHMTLADKIEACGAAHDAGYEWEFEEPVVSKDCKTSGAK